MQQFERFPIHIVSSVRNEQAFLPGLADSIRSQTERPASWTIVDDGSTDNTPAIIKDLEKQCDWISSITVGDRGYNARGYGNTKALQLGFSHALETFHVSGLSNMDADITFDKLTMASVYDSFLNNDNLGIYGGEIVEYRKGKWVPPVVLPDDFVRGACKVYRLACYDQIGGIVPRRGWDSIDNLKAAMLGWDVKRDTALLIRHNRPVGSQDGFVKDQYKAGRDAYYLGSDPLLVLARGGNKLIASKPYFFASMVFLSAYFGNAFLHKERYPDKQFLEFVKHKHRELLLKGFYRW